MSARQGRRTDLPTGTVTFLFTDIEGSTRLAAALAPATYRTLLEQHHRLMRAAFAPRQGVERGTQGDAFLVVFRDAPSAVAAALDAQRALGKATWPGGSLVRVRMGLHSGEGIPGGDDYVGLDINRAARIASAAHGGQVLISDATRALVEHNLPDSAVIRDLGRHRLKDLAVPEHLFQLVGPDSQSDFPPPRTLETPAGNLPMRLTSFLGREEELADLRRRLASTRLITLTGPAGIGKTTLAVELARATGASDGSWFVALDVVTDASDVATAIARTLGLFDGPTRPAAAGLGPFLADRSVLLVLDNFEHLLDAADLVPWLLQKSPGTRILVTSRAPLRVAGEQEYPVRPLDVADDPGVGAVRLFIERAQAVRPNWEPGDDIALVRETCVLLDGLALGVELAAARVSLLPIRGIRDRLAQHLPLPGRGRRDVPARQRTLEEAIAWSVDLLSPADRQLLDDLSVFEGGFDLEQAVEICSGPDGVDVVDGVATLVEQSLIGRDAGADSQGVRYRLLQTIRGFGLAGLADTGRERAVRDRHAHAFLALAERIAPQLPGGDQVRWIDRLALDRDDLRAATRWAIDAGETELALRLVGASWRFWQLAGSLDDGVALVDEVLAMPGAERPTTARQHALEAAGGIAYWRGDAARAERFYGEQLVIAEQLSDHHGVADATYNLVFTTYLRAEFAAATTVLDRAEALYRELGDERGVGRAEWARAMIAVNRGDAPASMPILERAITAAETTGDAWYHALEASTFAWASWMAGDIASASRWLIQAVAETRAMRDVATMTIFLPTAAIYALGNDHPTIAACLMGAYETGTQLYGVQPPGGRDFLGSAGDPLAQVREAIGDDALEEALARGRRMGVEEAFDLLLEIAGPDQAAAGR